MTSILLAGLTDHEAAALEIMIGMQWRGLRTVTLPRGLGLGVPEQTTRARDCHACVVDLFGFGMRRHTPEHEARLLAFLAGRSAVLLVWGSGGGWLERQLPLAPRQTLAWVSMPYSSADMLDALKKLHASDEASAPRARQQASAQAPMPAPAAQAADEKAVPAWRRAMALADKLKVGAERKAEPKPETVLVPVPPRPVPKAAPGSAAAPVSTVAPAAAPKPAAPPAFAASAPATVAPEPAVSRAPRKAAPLLGRRADAPAPPPLVTAPPAARLSADAISLSKGGFQAVCKVFPLLSSLPLVQLGSQLLAHDGVQQMRVGADAAFVIHAYQGWLASALPVPVLLKMLRDPSMQQSVHFSPLPPHALEETLRQLFGERFRRTQKPLDVLAWDLLADALRGVTLKPQGDLGLQLRRFPNFNQLSGVGPMDVQLAAICARVPQSIADLARAFPQHEQDVYRFAVLSVFSGLALVVPQPAAQPASLATQPAPAKAQVAARRGFFKSLLDKLF